MGAERCRVAIKDRMQTYYIDIMEGNGCTIFEVWELSDKGFKYKRVGPLRIPQHEVVERLLKLISEFSSADDTTIEYWT